MKFKALFALAISASLLTACFGGGGSEDYYFAFKESSGGKWGLVSASGKVLFEGEFKDQPTDADGGIFFANTGKDKKWQMYEASSRPSLICEDSFETIFPFYKEDVTLAVKEKGDILIIDKKGQEVATLEKAGADHIDSAHPFEEGLAIVKTSAGYGVVNTKGEVVVKPKYYFLDSFSDGVAIGLENKYKDEKNSEDIVYTVINATGETVFSFKGSKYSNGYHFKDGLMPICKKDGDEEKWGFINKKGEEVVKPTAKNEGIGGSWNKSVYVFKEDGKQWGLKSIANDEILIRGKYDILFFADDDGTLLWAGEYNDNRHELRWSLVNRKGDEITKDTYKYPGFFHGDFAPVKVSEGEWGFINRKGEDLKISADIHTLGGYSMPNVIYSQRRSDGDEAGDVSSVTAEPYDNSDSVVSSGSSVSSSSSVEDLFYAATTRRLKSEDLAGLSKAELRILRNYIFARHGYIFKSDDLREYFSQFDWYTPTYSNVSSMLSSTEKKNVDLIKAFE